MNDGDLAGPLGSANTARKRLSGSTLLITSSLPGTGDVGQLLVARMLRELEDVPLAVAAVVDAAQLKCQQNLPPQTPVRTWPQLHEQARSGPLNRSHQCLVAMERQWHRRQFRRQASQIAAFARSQGIQQVWSILGSLNVLEVTRYVARTLNVPLVTQVWDDIEHLGRQRSFHSFALRQLQHRFACCLSQSARTGVICETMAEDYQHRYHVNPIIVRLGASSPAAARTRATDHSKFTITFSGGMYCHSAWQSLINALDECRWVIAGKTVEIQVLSGEVRLRSRAAANIRFLGWRPTDEVSAALANSDLLYLPQPFEPHQHSLARLSFPTKMTDYVGSGRPVLVHCPAYGSLSELASRYPDLPICQSLQSRDLINMLTPLVSDQDAYARSAAASARIARELLQPAKFRRGVRQMLGLDDDDAASFQASGLLAGTPTS